MTSAAASLGPSLPVRLPVLADVLPGRRARDVVLVLGAALLTALAAGALPALRLARITPAQLLRVFADER